jgi:hypothetical protein
MSVTLAPDCKAVPPMVLTPVTVDPIPAQSPKEAKVFMVSTGVAPWDVGKIKLKNWKFSTPRTALPL